MTADDSLRAALVKKATGYRDNAPVFRVVQPSAQETVTEARALGLRVWPQFGDCSFRPEVVGSVTTMMRLPDDGRVDVFHPSGAVAGMMHPRSARMPLFSDEGKADRTAVLEIAHRTAETIAKSHVGANDELRFESKWEMKGQATTVKGEKSPVALFEVLGAFRRYLHGLPVLGRASVHVGVGGGSVVTRWGIDWRRVHPDAFAETPVITPDEGAKRVLDDMWWRRPERPFTLKDFKPKAFSLGYLSLSRRREQFVMQPVWLAVLAPSAPMTMGHVVAVPAAPQAFEPLTRPLPPVRK